jgi:hypothetical protein
MRDLPGKHPDASVKPAAGSCLDLFASALRTSHSSPDAVNDARSDIPLPDHGRLRIEQDRFRIWAANAAAFAEARWSLDYRLRELPEELDLVKSLLGTISSRLQSYESALLKAIKSANVDSTTVEAGSKAASTTFGSPRPTEATGGKDPDTDADDKEQEQTLSKPKAFNYDEALDSIHTSIDWLHRLSNMLRKAGIVNQNLRAQSYNLPGLDGDGLKNFYAWLVDRDFPGLSEQLKGRMASTMVERHRRILYRRERYEAGWKQQESYHREEQQTQPEQTTKQSGPVPVTEVSTQGEPSTNPSMKGAPSLLSKGAGTEPDRSRYYAPSSISTARSGALNHDAEMLLPPPPNACQTEPEFTCDLCCMILESQIGRKRTLWMYVVISVISVISNSYSSREMENPNFGHPRSIAT